MMFQMDTLKKKAIIKFRASKFSKGYGNKSKGSGEYKFHGLVDFDFGRSRSLEDPFLSIWFASISQCKYGWY